MIITIILSLLVERILIPKIQIDTPFKFFGVSIFYA